MTDVISLSAAFVAGIAGSAHCFAMCGGLAGALGMRNRSISANSLVSSLPYHAGRLSSYALAGALCGLLGASLQSVIDLSSTGVWLRVASGVLLSLIALSMLTSWNPLRLLEVFGAKFWQRLQPLVRRTASLNDGVRGLALGMLWGWLPCGLIYSMLLFAALSGHATAGASILLAFGLGTLPAMLTSSALASRVQGFIRQRWPRFASGVLMMMFGVWMVWASMPGAVHVHHH